MDVLSDILARIRFSGTLYFRTSFTAPWNIRVPSFERVARFHYANKGKCLVRLVAEEETLALEQGDLVIITKGASHLLYTSDEMKNDAVDLEEVVEKSGFTGKGTLVYGDYGHNEETQLVCGHFAFGDGAHHLLLDALPGIIHVKNFGETSGQWMESTLQLIGDEANRNLMGMDFIVQKMSEVIFAQALRSHIEGSAVDQPVLAGLADTNIAKALGAIHQKPEKAWTLGQLAGLAGMSRTSFTKRFTECMTITPMAYITRWRMEIARHELEETSLPITTITLRVGYNSEAAFSRAFKKIYGQAPATYRRNSRKAK